MLIYHHPMYGHLEVRITKADNGFVVLVEAPNEYDYGGEEQPRKPEIKVFTTHPELMAFISETFI